MGRLELALGLLIVLAVQPHARSDQLSAGSQADCLQQVQNTKYGAQDSAQAKETKTALQCRDKPCRDRALAEQQTDILKLRQDEIDGNLRCKQPHYLPPLQAQEDPAGYASPDPFRLGAGQTTLRDGVSASGPGSSYSGPGLVPNWRSGWAGPYEIRVNIAGAVPGRSYLVPLPRVAGSNSPWATAHGIYDGQNFLVDYLVDNSGRTAKQQPPLVIGTPLNP